MNNNIDYNELVKKYNKLLEYCNNLEYENMILENLSEKFWKDKRMKNNWYKKNIKMNNT